MNVGEVRELFDAQMRRGQQPDGTGATVHADENVVRFESTGTRGWNGVVWSALDEHTADAVIAREVAHFGRRSFEWKLYDYDSPADLADRLRAAGFIPEPVEALMIAETAGQVSGATPPAGVHFIDVADEAGIAMLIRVHEEVFGTDHSALRRSLVAQLHNAPSKVRMVVAMAGDRPVCSARIEFHEGVDFASLWGGGTVPDWRGRGIYRALVAHRAGIAAARGYRYLQVDASGESRPILERLGFVTIARTTPFNWNPNPSDPAG